MSFGHYITSDNRVATIFQDKGDIEIGLGVAYLKLGSPGQLTEEFFIASYEAPSSIKRTTTPLLSTNLKSRYRKFKGEPVNRQMECRDHQGRFRLSPTISVRSIQKY